MKNTRKKMLLSSIAMLLVALIALGSATFAWYYTNQSVTAGTSEFKASTADGLVIRHQVGDAWGTEVTDLAKKTSLSPASIDYNAAFDASSTPKGCTATGEDFDDGTMKAGSYSEIAHIADGNNFLIDHFFVGTQGTTAKSNVTFTITASAAANTYMNLAIYIDGTLTKVYTSGSNTTLTNRVATQNSQTPTTFTAEAMGNNTVTASFSAAPVGTDLSAETGTRVDIVAFADGENPNCKSSNVKLNNFTVSYAFAS